MTSEDIGSLISFVGLLTQTGGALLLVILFVALLRGHPRPQPYFREWTRAWGWLLAALTGVLAQYAIPHVLAADTLAVRAANLLYQAGKLLFVAHLLAGTLNYVMGVRPRAFLPRAVPLALAYAVLSATLPGVLLNGVMLLQAPLVILPFAVCAWLLLRLPPSRRTLGSRATGAVFGMIAALWVGYAVAFAVEGIPVREALTPLYFLLQYNSYLDLLLQVLLGYGMVVLLLEDAKREADDARAQLSLAHDRLKRVALYDPLTGALNRRAYDEGFGLEAVGARFGTALMLDMDNLKHVNDAWGHAAGDELLRRLVETVRGCVRPLDRVYRWGGDEFLVLFPTALPEDVVPRIRAAVNGANAALAEDQEWPLELQVSVGAASFAGTEQIAGAIQRADRAMYEEKLRNRRLFPRPELRPAS